MSPGRESINSVPQKKIKYLWFTWDLSVRSKDRLQTIPFELSMRRDQKLLALNGGGQQERFVV